ncbi:hypothetical protein Ahy_A03g013182 [Arachis hypogaea]|uniref:Protein FAR1-RELATED SEQUENCE n=1 Tax=Arachis hypogaea TaxID=3818 RepID=A0A445DUW4_ARAHY|nr:hypothetical protein Ahy_A03g013182 [Arachis hypogaea]
MECNGGINYIMENDGKESYMDGDQYEDLSVEYECSSDESDDMVDVTIDEAEADIINLITDLTIEDIWGLNLKFVNLCQICQVLWICVPKRLEEWMLMATLIQDNWFAIKQEKDIGSTLKETIGKGSIGQLLVSTAGRGFISFITIERVTGKSMSLRVNTIIHCVYLYTNILLPRIVGLRGRKNTSRGDMTRRGKVKDERWSEIIFKYGLAENEWVQGIYNDKMKGYRIFEGALLWPHKNYITNYVDSKTSLLEFMHKFSEVLRHYRNNYLTADFETFYKFPVLTTKIFKLVKDEIEAAGALNVTECPNSGDIVEYNMSEYFNQQWQLKVSYNKEKDLFACECRLFETRGLPCPHIFGVLKHRKAKCVPISLILKRWTREAKSDFIYSIGEQDSTDDIVQTLRCADYREISCELLKLILKVQNKSDAQVRLSPTSALIGDPTVVKSKGAPRKVPKGQKRRRCSHYKS